MQDEDDDPSKKVFHGTNRCTALTTLLRHPERGHVVSTMAAAAAASSPSSSRSWTIKLSAHALHCTCARSIMPLEKQCSSLVFCQP